MKMKHAALIWSLLVLLPIVYSQTVVNGVEFCDYPLWVRFRNNCYLFADDQKARVSFYDAEEECLRNGGHLVSIHSEVENDFLITTANSRGIHVRQWIGLNILNENSSLTWTDETLLDYLNITPKEYYKKEKCFAFHLDKKGWKPEDCGLHYLPLCQRPADKMPTTIIPPTVPPTPRYCPKDWIQFGQKCYKYIGKQVADRLQFREAKMACWALGKGTDLVSIHSAKEQAFLTQHLRDFGSSVWIGIEKLNSDEIGHEIVFGWVDNSRYDFKNWALGHPPPGTWKYCGSLSYEGVAKGEWIADYCSIHKKGYICQRPSDVNLPKPNPEPNTCDAGYEGYRKSCYKYFEEPKTQENAELSCQNLGGHLVSIADAFEQSFLYNFVESQLKLIWNGLSADENTQYLKWTDKQPIYYTNWVENRPHWDKNQPMCSALDTSRDLQWNVTDCSFKLPYICKITNDDIPTFPEVLGTCSGEESSLIDIGDEYCYYVGDSVNKILSWDSTLRYCTSKGFHMVKTSSLHQVNSLVAQLWRESKNINLGLMKKFDESGFAWVDGSELDFTNWEDGEPSGVLGKETCVAFSQMTGKWVTTPCRANGIVLCQSPKIVSK